MPQPLAPLPRALTPLPGEGIAGLILRLAHRLDLTPAMLFARTGLMVPGFTYVSGRFLLGLEERLTTFAHVTRLTPVEAISLTLAPHAGNYPPIGGSVHIRRRR